MSLMENDQVSQFNEVFGFPKENYQLSMKKIGAGCVTKYKYIYKW
jgi:hypothetical protein